MSEHAVKQLHQSFKREWNQYLGVSKHIELDDCWPSTGTLDLLSYCLRLKSEVPAELDGLLSGSAAYLASIVRRCWSTFVEEVKLSRGEEGVTLTARGGEWIPQGEVVTFHLEKELRALIREVPFPFPLTRTFSKPITFSSNIVSPFAMSICTGQHPSIDGPWQSLSNEDFAPCMDGILKELAKESAEHYARLFPKEPLGQMAELYLSRLLYPLPMMGEPLPLVHTVAELQKFFTDYKITPESVRPLARNLCLSPDDLLSTCGIAYAVALADTIPPPEVLAAAEIKGQYISLLRRAINTIRADFDLGEDWIETGIKNSDAERRFEIEKELRLIPWLYLSLDRLKKDARPQHFKSLLKALCDFNLAQAIEINDALLQDNMSDLDLRLQRIKLEMAGGDAEKANNMFHSLLSEPGADDSPEYYNLWGLCALSLNKGEDASKYFNAALSLPIRSGPLTADIANNLAWSNMIRGDFGRALENLDKSLRHTNSPVTPLLNKMTILWELGRHEEALQIRTRLFALAPSDRRVFAGLTLNERVVAALVQ